jgi:peptide/nickel transport system ATP-binding protein
MVGLDGSAADRFPHEFSGGQRQRIGIARALAMEPKLLVADEPVSALDVSVQGQVLELLDDIRKRLNLAMLFITHDLRVAAQVCDTIAVMRRGKIVELGTAREVFTHPRDAYTRSLLDAIPGKGWQIPEDLQSVPAGAH